MALYKCCILLFFIIYYLHSINYSHTCIVRQSFFLINITTFIFERRPDHRVRCVDYVKANRINGQCPSGSRVTPRIFPEPYTFSP